jgi:hypothetical protein
MASFTDVVVPVVASPAVVLLVRLVPYLRIPARPAWHFSVSFVVFIMALAGAALNSYFVATHRFQRILRLLIGLGAFLLFLGVYSWLSGFDPRSQWASLYDVAAFSSFFICYIAMGFVLADVCSFRLTKTM